MSAMQFAICDQQLDDSWVMAQVCMRARVRALVCKLSAQDPPTLCFTSEDPSKAGAKIFSSWVRLLPVYLAAGVWVLAYPMMVVVLLVKNKHKHADPAFKLR